MKVLIVFNHPAPYKVNFFNELAKSVDLTVIFERNKERDRSKKFYSEKNYDFNNIKVKGISFGNENFYSNAIVKHLKNNKYDLVLMNGYSTIAEMKAIKYLRKHNIKYVMYINGGIIKEKEPKWKLNLKRKYLGNAPLYFSPDERSNKYLVYYGADSNKILNYPYSTIHKDEILETKLSKEEKQAKRKELNLEAENLFVTCGQLIKRKNYFELIKAWKEQPDNNLLVIIGDGKEESKYQEYIQENHMNNVKIIGFLPRKSIFEIYKASDAFIFSSLEDIYGHVINEALSQGLPVISTPNVNASQHLIKNNYNGYIIESIDSKEFANMVNKVLELDAFENCTNTAKENTYEQMAKTFLTMLERACE